MKLTAGILFAATLLAAGAPAWAQTYRLVAPDGTVHFTNTPTDPRYRREGLISARMARAARASLAVARPPYAKEIESASKQYGVPESLIRAVIRVESAYNRWAVSRRGARGLMQLMPETAALLGVRDIFNPRQNIDGGVRHLRGLIERFDNDLPLALAAYNAGEQAVAAYRGIPPYPETRDYVARVLRQFGTQSPPLLPRSTYRVVEREGAVVYTNIPPRGRVF